MHTEKQPRRIAHVAREGDSTSLGKKAAEHFIQQRSGDAAGWTLVPKPDHASALDALCLGEVDFAVVEPTNEQIRKRQIEITDDATIRTDGEAPQSIRFWMVRRLKVAFLGDVKNPSDRSTFGAKAAEHFFGSAGCEFLPNNDHTAVLDALWTRKVDYGVVAIENAVDGVVNESARGVARLTARGIHVLEEVVLPVKFYFVARCPLDLTKDIAIYAHPTAKMQCLLLKRRLENLLANSGKTLDIKFPGKDNSSGSNGLAAKMAAEGEEGTTAAITTWEGMESKGLKLIRLNKKDLSDELMPSLKDGIPQTTLELIEPELQKRFLTEGESAASAFRVGDFEKAITRFWKLGHGQFPAPIEYDKKRRYNRTSILLNLDHDSPGGLTEALEHFSRRGCNLSIAYPIPIPGRQFEYSFMLEFEDGFDREGAFVSGHIDHPDGKLRAAYEELLNSGISLNAPIIFGAYPTTILGTDRPAPSYPCPACRRPLIPEVAPSVKETNADQ